MSNYPEIGIPFLKAEDLHPMNTILLARSLETGEGIGSKNSSTHTQNP